MGSFVKIRPKKVIDAESNAITILQKKCDDCDLLRGKTADSIFILSEQVVGEKKSSMLACATYGDNIVAIHAPDDLEDYSIFERVFDTIFSEIEHDDTIIVFSQDSYEAIEIYNFDKSINVVLAT